MAHIIADRVKENSLTEGTGDITLGGAETGFRAFSDVMSVGDVCFYCIDDGQGAWEVGRGTYSAANVLTRSAVAASSNANNLVALSSNSKAVFITNAASNIQPPVVDLTGASSDYTLALGESAKITYTDATSLALKIGTVQGLYEMTIVGTDSYSSGHNGVWQLRANNTTTTAGAWDHCEFGSSVATGSASEPANPAGWHNGTAPTAAEFTAGRCGIIKLSIYGLLGKI